MNDVITIVSGLPRSGTSMMMRMLEAGGMVILTDSIRKADIDNPRGYYEFEKVKKIKEDASWLEDARGKVFKMVSMLLYDLPMEKTYKIIFMKRNINEMMKSQRKMIERQKPEQVNFDSEKMSVIYEKHLNEVEPWVKAQENMDVIFVKYNDLIENAEENSLKVIRFLGRRLDLEKMVAVVDKNLYRNRTGDSDNAP